MRSIPKPAPAGRWVNKVRVELLRRYAFGGSIKLVRSGKKYGVETLDVWFSISVGTLEK